MRCIRLHPGLENRRRAYLREPTAADELAADEGVIVLLDRLLVAVDAEAVAPGQAARLPVCDRDRLLATLQRDLIGERIVADARCAACGSDFSVDFPLNQLTETAVPRELEDLSGPDEHGCYRFRGVTFRLPSSADVAAVAAVAPEERLTALLASCVVAGEISGRETELEAAMAAAGPTLDSDLETVCPHCVQPQMLRFAIGHFLLKSLANERRFLMREVHRIACAYGWSHAEIMSLPRRDRQTFVGLIGAGSHAARGRPSVEG